MLKEENQINPEETMFYGMTWEQLYILLKSDLSFMKPEEVFGEMKQEEKLNMQKRVVRRIAKQAFSWHPHQNVLW